MQSTNIRAHATASHGQEKKPKDCSKEHKDKRRSIRTLSLQRQRSSTNVLRQTLRDGIGGDNEEDRTETNKKEYIVEKATWIQQNIL